LIAVGLAIGLTAGAASELRSRLAVRCMSIGILLLIALPMLRVALTSAFFTLHRDYLFAAISGAVLVIIALGLLLGIAGIH
jgi:uncharacterized membrane protein